MTCFMRSKATVATAQERGHTRCKTSLTWEALGQTHSDARLQGFLFFSSPCSHREAQVMLPGMQFPSRGVGGPADNRPWMMLLASLPIPHSCFC